MKHFYLAIQIFIFLMSVPVLGQKSAKLKEIHRDADYFFEREDYREAITQYMLLLDNGYQSANIKFRIGVCYLNIPGEETRSIPYLEEASKQISTKYKSKEIEETKAPLHALFFLGNAYRINNELAKALKAYDKFTDHPGFFGNYNLEMVDAEIRACERAKLIQDSPVDVDWQNVGEPINTSTSETCPVVSGNDSVLVYLSEQKLYNAIFFCKKTAFGSWNAPVNINPQVISDGDFYPTGLSFDGKELYLVRKEMANSDIYVSYFRDDKWSKVQRLNGNINSTSLENYASISPDGKMLFFTSNRNSKAGFDIFYSIKDENGDWGKAQNMGKTINTPLDEATPFMCSDNKTLYFSSKGHFNMGGYDVFYSTTTNFKKWQEPSNIGYPVNNTNDNLFYCPVLKGTTGYYSRITKDGKGGSDIYKLDIKTKLSLNKIALEK